MPTVFYCKYELELEKKDIYLNEQIFFGSSFKVSFLLNMKLHIKPLTVCCTDFMWPIHFVLFEPDQGKHRALSL